MTAGRHPEIELALAKLQGYFPTPEFTDWQIAVWASDLSRYDLPIIQEAVETLGHMGTRGRPLQYADIEAVCEDIFRDHLRRQTPALGPGEVTAAAPDEVRAILDRYWDGVGQERRALADARRGRESNDPARRVEAVRRLAAARIARDADREGERPPARPTALATGTMRTACGAAVGTHAVEVDGVWCCPNCGSPIADGCVGGAA